MTTIFCTWSRSRGRWRFREVVHPFTFSSKAMERRKKKYPCVAKAFVKLPDEFITRRKKRHQVATAFYAYQHLLGLPVIK